MGGLGKDHSAVLFKGDRGNKPYELDLMPHLHILQNLYELSDKGTAAEGIDSRAFSDFCGIKFSDQVPDGDTIGRFRNILVRNGLQEKLFAQVLELLAGRGLILKKGTIVDSTIFAAPPSTKNREKKRNPDAHSVKKGNIWHFGYKAHIGVDRDTGLVHHIEVTGANVHDVAVVPQLLTREEDIVHGDSGYLGAEKRKDTVSVYCGECRKASGTCFFVFHVILNLWNFYEDIAGSLEMTQKERNPHAIYSPDSLPFGL